MANATLTRPRTVAPAFSIRPLPAFSQSTIPDLCEYRVFGEWRGMVTVPKSDCVHDLAAHFAWHPSGVHSKRAWKAAEKVLNLKGYFSHYALVHLREACRQDGKLLPAGLRVFQAIPEPTTLGENPPPTVVDAWHEAMDIPNVHFLYLKPVWNPDGTPAHIRDLQQEKDRVIQSVRGCVGDVAREVRRAAKRAEMRQRAQRLLGFDPILTVVQGRLVPGKQLHLIGWW